MNRTFLTAGLLCALIGAIIGSTILSQLPRPVDAHAVGEDVPVQITDTLPENKDGELETRSDMSIFDLRAWRPVPAGATTQPISPVNYLNDLVMVKRKSCDWLYAHYATSGLRIDLRCLSQPYRVLRKQARDIHTEQGDKEYVLAVNVSRVPVGTAFPVFIEATYWNGFSGADQESASTYSDGTGPVPEELGLTILLPTNKPFKRIRLESSPTQHESWTPYEDAGDIHVDASGHYACWMIHHRVQATHYRMTWDW